MHGVCAWLCVWCMGAWVHRCMGTWVHGVCAWLCVWCRWEGTSNGVKQPRMKQRSRTDDPDLDPDPEPDPNPNPDPDADPDPDYFMTTSELYYFCVVLFECVVCTYVEY